jgi:hypothetical protein
MTDETRPAFEAGAEAEGHRPKAEGQKAEAPLSILAATPKAAKILAEAEAARIKAEAASAAQDANAARKAKAEQLRLEAKLAQANAKAERKLRSRAAAGKAARGLAHKATWLLDKIRSEAAASYSAFVYVVVVGVAVFSQRNVFKDQFAWGDLPAFGAAIFIEGAGLAFYATSVSMRLDNRSGLIPRLIAWLVTSFAAFMQYKAHEGTQVGGVPLLSYALAAASVMALLLAEIRTAHKVGKRLEELDQKDRPQARLGFRFCLRYPRQAFWAISAMIAIPSIRTRSRALRAGRLIQTLRARRQLSLDLMRIAEAEVKRAGKAGASAHVLMRLEEFAHYGLEAVGLQAALTAKAETLVEAEATEAADAIKAEATVERPKAERPIRKAVAQRPASAAQDGAKAIEAESAEAGPGGDEPVDLVWAGRPGGLIAWADRLAELAEIFPRDQAEQYAADQYGVPGRAQVLSVMAERKLAGDPNVRHTWTNKGWVTWAMGDLRELRKRGLADPQRQTLDK